MTTAENAAHAGPSTTGRGVATDWEAITEALAERAGGRCEVHSPVCRGGLEIRHHKKRRSQGGEHDLGDLLFVCRPCHDYLHAHPAESYEKGWLIRMSADL